MFVNPIRVVIVVYQMHVHRIVRIHQFQSVQTVQPGSTQEYQERPRAPHVKSARRPRLARAHAPTPGMECLEIRREIKKVFVSIIHVIKFLI